MKIKIISVILILALLTTLLCSCNVLPTFYTLKYVAEEGGTIVGKAEQSVEEGKDGEAVMAIADDGYYFVGWSDGISEPIRKEANVSGNITVTAKFEQTTTPQSEFTVKYIAGKGGSIQGETEQTVERGQDATPVTAVADEDYEFVKWSDGITTATRQDTVVSKNITVTAIFKELEQPEPTTKTYTLNYNFGETDEEKPEQIIFVENNIVGITLPILTREHFTFHGWYCGGVQVADTNGELLLDEELLTFEVEEIYAKWTANETFTYKILLVYVTRIDAMLRHKDMSIKEKVHVDYTMSEQERELCYWITIRTKQRLDEMLDGLVDFQVDEYYTTETINEDSYIISFGQYIINNLIPQNITEVKDLVDNYDSCIAITNHYANYNELHTSSGSAFIKHAEVRLERVLDIALNSYHFKLDELIEVLKNDEDINLYGHTYLVAEYLMEPIYHELAHTIELRVNLYNYHLCVIGQRQYPSSFQANRAYYLHEFEIDGEKVGIPYAFWKGNIGKITYTVSQGVYGDAGLFDCQRNGTSVIPGRASETYDVIYGESITVTVRPFREYAYRFVKWNDGITTATRTDIVWGDIELFAIFEPIDYKITIKQTAGGFIARNSEIVADGATFTLNVETGSILIKAIANEGYRFVAWSDADTDWQKSVWVEDLVEMVDKNYNVSLYAIFEKIE